MFLCQDMGRNGSILHLRKWNFFNLCLKRTISNEKNDCKVFRRSLCIFYYLNFSITLKKNFLNDWIFRSGGFLFYIFSIVYCKIIFEFFDLARFFCTLVFCKVGVVIFIAFFLSHRFMARRPFAFYFFLQSVQISVGWWKNANFF